MKVLLWNGSIKTSRFLARTIARFKLMLSVLTLNAPIRSEREIHEKKFDDLHYFLFSNNSFQSNRMISPVSFLFADDHRLSFIGGEQALANIVKSLFIAAEGFFCC